MIVRLFKLSCGVLDQVNEGRQEQVSTYSRQIFEAVVSVAYLAESNSDAITESYLRHSLRHERRLRDEILAKIAARGGEKLPIEDRMLKSIARAERFSGVSLDSIDLKEKGPWGGKDTRQKAAAVGLEKAYMPAFGGFSRNVHGGWHDLFEYHLNAEEDETSGEVKFRPKMDWRRVRPQILFTLAWLLVRACEDGVEVLGGPEAAQLLESRLSDLEDRIRKADDAHEQYLSGKIWPET